MSNQNDRNRNHRSNDAGKRQQQDKQQNSNRPWGRASAVIEEPGRQRSDDTRARFVFLGVVWKTENGNLKLRLEAEPQQWRDPHYPRTVIIVQNEEREK